MNKKYYSLLLASLLFSACNSSTTPKVVTQKTETNSQTPQETAISEVVMQQEVFVQAPQPIIEKVAPVSSTQAINSNEISVSFIENKPLIQDQGMMHIDSFMDTLQSTLTGLIKSDRTHQTAMGGCSSMAMGMTKDYNALVPDTKIRRTALKYRNPKNKPDDTDTLVMEQIVSSRNFKKPLIVELPTHYRVYKPLIIKQPCLICHGDRSTISPTLVKMIDKKYPKDLATGFNLGEFRGVVVAEVQK